MRGRKPRGIELAAHDEQLLRRIAHSRKLPWFQVQRARLLLAVAAGERVQAVAAQMQCDPSTVWRICRHYEEKGLARALAEAPRIGHPAEISPSGPGTDRPTGLLGANRQGAAPHPLEQPRVGASGGGRRHRPSP